MLANSGPSRWLNCEVEASRKSNCAHQPQRILLEAFAGLANGTQLFCFDVLYALDVIYNLVVVWLLE